MAFWVFCFTTRWQTGGGFWFQRAYKNTRWVKNGLLAHSQNCWNDSRMLLPSPPFCKLHAAITWARRSNLSPSSSFSACLFVFVNKSSSATPEQVAPQVWSIREKLQLLWCWFGEYLLASDKKYHSQMGNRPSKCSVSACLWVYLLC